MVTRIIAVGSVDGVCTTAAVLRNVPPKATVVFTQAFLVDELDPSKWEPSRVLLVDLAVNNRDEAMTVSFLRRLVEAGHELVGIIDEHDATAWFIACAAAGIDYEKLAFQPVNQEAGDIKSSGALLRSLLDDGADKLTLELCETADQGDRMNFDTHIGLAVNRAMKSDPSDKTRREYLARHYSQKRDPDAKIKGWVADYNSILETHAIILADLVDLGDRVARIDATKRHIDMRTLLGEVFKRGYLAVLMEGLEYDSDSGEKVPQLSVSFAPSIGLGIDETMDEAGIPYTGSGTIVTVLVEYEDEVVQALRSALH